jgi:hypothetical protein
MRGGACKVIPGETDTGTPVFSVVVKRTYVIVPGRTVVRAERDSPLLDSDHYYEPGDPLVNSVRYEVDLVPYKIATDVVFVGKAHSPGGAPVRQLRASFAVDGYRKSLLVTGDRVCGFRAGANPVFSDPQPFRDMEIRYERSYGGVDERSLPEIPIAYPRNHIGRGFTVRNIKENVEGLLLPNIEDPAEPLTSAQLIPGDPTGWNRLPMPQGLGWFHRAWYPRCSFLAAMPPFIPPGETMKEELLGWVPRGQADLAAAMRLPSRDARFFNGASPGLVVPYLNGDEQFLLENLTPSGKIGFSLSGERPSIFLDIGMGSRQLEPYLHSVTIRAEDGEVDLVWRGAHPYPGIDWLPNMKTMHFEVV